MRILFVSDLHTDSIYGLTPRSPENKVQSWLFETWNRFTEEYKNPDILVLNGDLCEGVQSKILGVDANTTNTDEQVSDAVELLEPLIGKNTKKIYGVNGSGYHGGEGLATNLDRRVTELLNGQFQGSVLEFTVGDVSIQCCHGGTSPIVNPLSYLLREMNLARINSSKRHQKIPNILVRSHQHEYYSVSNSIMSGYITPCWQYNTPFMYKKTVNKIPDIGALQIETGKETKVYPILYPIPEEIHESMRGYEVILENKIQNKKKQHEKEVADQLKKFKRL